jgi:hypothetical protein
MLKARQLTARQLSVIFLGVGLEEFSVRIDLESPFFPLGSDDLVTRGVIIADIRDYQLRAKNFSCE